MENITKEIAHYSDFEKLEIRIGKIEAAEPIPNSDKLLKLTVNFAGALRTICAGIAEYYQPEEVVGKSAPFITNLAPRMLRGVESQGMMLMASEEGGHPTFLVPEKTVASGSIVR